VSAIATTTEHAAVAAPQRTSLVVPTALAGTFLASLTAQFAGTNLADIQGSVGVSADEASWISTIYTVANLVGILLSPLLTRTLGMRRYFVGSAVLFAVFAWLCAIATTLPMLLIVRALQGLAGGGFGPIAFGAVFTAWKRPLLPLGLSLLAAALVLSANAGPVFAGPIEAAWGWRGLFVVQFWVAGFLAWAGLAWMPKGPLNWSGLKTDWAAVALLALAIGALLLLLSQGTRRFWLESDLIAWTASVSIGAWIGFFVVYRHSPIRIINIATLLTRRFGLPIFLNLIFRATFAVTGYLIPLLVGLTQGWRPLQTAHALTWVVLAQVGAFPLAWRLVHRFDGRAVMLAGLLSFAVGTALAAFATNQTSGDQMHLSLVLLGAGQMLFLIPALLVGALSLKPEDGPTATIAFNATTVGGTTLGTGLVSHFVTEREKFHSSVLVEDVSWIDGLSSDRLSSLTGAFQARLGDNDANVLRAVAQVAASVRREAWLLAINDGFLLIAAVLVLCAIGALLIGPSPPVVRPLPPGDAS
jgi:DHA2 family multidrug resistance protein